MTWPQAINKVLGESGEALHYNEITDRIVAQSLRSSLGATPSATVNACIAASIKHEGSDSPYVRVAKGTFALRAPARGVTVLPLKLTPEIVDPEETEEQYEILTSFGMFWRRNEVKWLAKPKLLGTQKDGATAVDFYKQLGVYLLYDGREVIYVGRTIDRPLGLRLFEHTRDRMAARWDRFSWFGLLPVSEAGELGTLPPTFNTAKLIEALEAILIESLEPRQNRKKGDGIGSVEYIQRTDPEVEKERFKTSFEAALKKL